MAILVNFVFVQFTSAVTGPGTAWSFCRRITLSPGTPLADFQVKVTLAAGQYTGMNVTGNDLRFYDINNTSCNYWIESWNNTATSTIWVKVPVSGTTYLYMYYGNASAPATSNGANVFDFFDGFDGSSLGANWHTSLTNGAITVSGGAVTVTCTTASSNNTTPYISSTFTPSSTSFFLETKHHEGGYGRNRFYATTSYGGVSPIAVGDYGYFSDNGNGTGAIFWGGFPTYNLVPATEYLTRWQITDGSTYNWYTLLYSSGAVLTNGSRTTTYGSNIRYITIAVTERTNTPSVVDWVRVRKYAATEPGATVSSQVTNVTASITAQTNVLCNGQSTGSATVTAAGGSGGYTYLWNSTPTQSTQTAINLPAGTISVTVTENSIGLSGTATTIITESTVVTATVTNQTNITCFAANDGTITVSASGGASPYAFSVNNGLDWFPATGTDLRLFTGLLPNNPYRIKVKDSNGCISH
jgi:hypothetical protein